MNRGKLQDHIIQVTVKVEKDTEVHKNYEQELINKISALQSDLEAEKRRQAQREKSWREEKEDMLQKHHNEIQKVNDEKERVRA